MAASVAENYSVCQVSYRGNWNPKRESTALELFVFCLNLFVLRVWQKQVSAGKTQSLYM